MCGICGLIIRKPSAKLAEPERLVKAMSDALMHRGPDDSGALSLPAKGVFFGHRRLSIIDLSPAGRQPLYNETRTVAAMVNGEIYNYPELREELAAKGHRFQSLSDSEIVPHLFEDEREKTWTRLRGMYAVAVCDLVSGDVFLARDPLGIKPLYVYDAPDFVAFASEIRAFRAIDLHLERSVDGLLDFLLLGSIPSPRTLWHRVRALLPGEHIHISNGRVSSARPMAYVRQCCVASGQTSRPSPEVLRECIRDSVRRHLISDAPIGVFLSGGIDSGALAGIASEVSSAEIRTLSVTLPGHALDEAGYANQTAALYRTQHTEIPLDRAGFEQDLALFLDHLDMPSIDGFNTFIVSKAARQAGLTVALSGLGGDELFCGYPTFGWTPNFLAADKIAHWLGRPGREAASSLLARLRPSSAATRVAETIRSFEPDRRAAYLAYRGLLVGRMLEQLVRPELAGAVRAAQERYLDETAWATDRALTNNLAVSGLELSRYMSAQLLRDTDAMSMAHSLEVRVPLVDTEVVSAALPFLHHAFSGDGSPKWLLRQALDKPLPPSVVRRKKQGFVFPWQEWLAGAVQRDFAARRAEGKGMGILRPEAVEWWESAYQRGWAHWSCFWAIYLAMVFGERD